MRDQKGKEGACYILITYQVRAEVLASELPELTDADRCDLADVRKRRPEAGLVGAPRHVAHKHGAAGVGVDGGSGCLGLGLLGSRGLCSS